MKQPILPLTRRSLTRLLMMAPIFSFGCGGEKISVDLKTGEKRRERLEALQKKADAKRKP